MTLQKDTGKHTYVRICTYMYTFIHTQQCQETKLVATTGCGCTPGLEKSVLQYCNNSD